MAKSKDEESKGPKEFTLTLTLGPPLNPEEFIEKGWAVWDRDDESGFGKKTIGEDGHEIGEEIDVTFRLPGREDPNGVTWRGVHESTILSALNGPSPTERIVLVLWEDCQKKEWDERDRSFLDQISEALDKKDLSFCGLVLLSPEGEHFMFFFRKREKGWEKGLHKLDPHL